MLVTFVVFSFHGKNLYFSLKFLNSHQGLVGDYMGQKLPSKTIALTLRTPLVGIAVATILQRELTTKKIDGEIFYEKNPNRLVSILYS